MRQTFVLYMLTLLLSLAIHILAFPVLWFAVLVDSSAAQILPITPSGLNTSVSDPLTAEGKTQFDITGGTRGGTNLFHSFGEFNVPTNHIANFLNGSGLGTSNILGRVTGGNPSSIFGSIQTTGFGNANLFLMNPAGIIFGPNASLNVGGSVAFTAADYLRLDKVGGPNAGVFHADPAHASLLTSASVDAFGFLGSNPAAITVQGSTFKVSDGQNISLVGGDITIEGATLGSNNIQPAQLLSRGGQINFASAQSPGEFVKENLDHASNVNGRSFGSLGTIQIGPKSVIDVSGDGSGTVLIRGGHLVMDDSRVSANTTGPAVKPLVGQIGAGIDIEVVGNAVIRDGSLIETNVSKEVSPGIGSRGVRVKADHIEVLGLLDPNTQVVVPTRITSSIAPGSTGGRSGNIELEANSIMIQDGGDLETLTRGAGDAGNIILRANKDINIALSNVFSGSINGSGNAGNIELTSTNGNISTALSSLLSQARDTTGNAGSINMTALQGDILLEGSEISNFTFRGGTLGGIHVAANNLTLVGSNIAGNNLSSLTPGNILISLAGNLSLTDTSFIETVSRGPAPAADLTIMAQNINITGNSFLSTETKSLGDGGHLNVMTDSLTLRNGGQIKSPSAIGVDPNSGAPVTPSGTGGTIHVQGLTTPSATVLIEGKDSKIFTDAVGTGSAGDIVVNAKSVTLQNGGAISASTTGTDPRAIGGSIIVNAIDHVTMTNGASITAGSTVKPETPNSGIANAGNISINAGRQLELQNASSITTTTQSSQANGGNIDIRAIDRVRLVNGTISTSVEGEAGSGGNIFIDPNVVILQGSKVTTEAIGGAGGNITFVTPLFLMDLASQVSARSQRGVSGTVNILSPLANLSSTVGQLVSKTSPPQVLLQNRCVALAGGEQSTFILAGRDSHASDPGGWLSSPLSMDHLMGQGMVHAAVSIAKRTGLHQSPAIVASADETQVLSLRRLAPPGFLVRTFAIGPTGCHS